MKNLTPARLSELLGNAGTFSEDISSTEISAVVTDSRKIVPGCLFVPLRGEKVDGHIFLRQAVESGAMLVLTASAEAAEGLPYIPVDDTKAALRTIAHAYLEDIGCKVVSVTGSVGKTSTKETIASVLSQKYKVKKTPGNFNNDLGLPFSIFTLEEGDEIAVLEMGINHFGEMDVLASIAPPDLSVITNIGECHLEFLGDRDGVLRAKTEVFRHLKEGAGVILNGDDDKLRTIREVNGKAPVFYGIDDPAEIYADNIEYLGMEAARCVIHLPEESFAVRIPYPGKHMVMNALAAAACGTYFGLAPFEIRRGIEALTLPGGRFRTISDNGVTVIDDCYNANPMSMKASLRVLGAAEGRRIAILGGMGELGPDEAVYHAEVGTFAAGAGIDLLITAGSLAQEISDAAGKADPKLARIHFPDNEALIAALPQIIRKGDAVLVKASHAMHFEEVVAGLTALSF